MAAGATYADDPIVEDPDPDPSQAELEATVEQPVEEAEKPVEEEALKPEQPRAAVQPRQLWHADPVVDAAGNVVTPGQAPKPAQAQVGDITPLTDAQAQEPGIDIPSNGYTKGRGNQSVTNVILHSTDGSEQSDINTLTQSGKVGVHYYTTRDGRVMHFVNDADSAWHAGLTKYGDSGNPYTIGIEQEHVDGQQDWPDAQVQATARTAAAILKRNPQLSINDIIGHSDIAPERKVDPVDYPWDKFRSYVNAYLGAPGTLPTQTVAQQGPIQSWQLDPVVDAAGNVTMPGVAPAPKAVSVEPGKVVVQAKPGFYQDEDPNTWATGTATKFGYNDPNDPGVGSTWTGKLNTNNTYLYGVAIPQSVLEAQFGHNYAAMRRARVDIVNPQTGERMRVPIVDVGPGADALNNGVITDFTEATNRALGNKDGTQYALNIVPNAGPDVLKNPQNFWDEQDALAHGINTAGVHKTSVAQGGGPYWQTDPLVPAPLVTAADQARTYQNESQIGALTSLAQSTTNLPDLYKRLDQPILGTKDPTSGQMIGAVSDQNRLAFQQNLKNELTQAAQTQYGITDPNAAFARAMTEPGFGDYAAEFGKKLMGNLQQAFSVLGTADVDRQRLNQAVSEMAPDASADQRNALANDLVQADPQTRSNMLGAYLPYTSTIDPTELVPSIERLGDPDLQAAKAADTAKIKASMAANMATDLRVSGKTATWVLDNLAAVPANVVTGAVPPWMFAQIYQQSLAEQQAQHPELDPSAQEANAAKSAMINTVGQEVANRLLLGGGGALLGGLKASWQRALGQVAVNTAGQAAIAGGSQALTNLATGEPLTQNVLQSTGAGAIVGGTFGAAHAAGELAHPALGETKTPERAQATTGPTGARIRGPEAATLEQGAVEAVAPPQEAPMQPMASAAEVPPTVQPPAVPQEAPVPPAVTVPTHQDIAQRALEISAERERTGAEGDATADWLQAEQELIAKPPVQPAVLTPTERPAAERLAAPTTVDEPWISTIANRFTQQRASAGEIGEVAPGQGVSTQDLVNRGLRMPPEEVAQHVSDVMQNRGGDPVLQAAAIRAEEARLSQRSAQASRIAEADPSNTQARLDANNAFQDLTDFHNGPVAKLKNNWHAQGMGMQGELPLDLSTYNGMREQWLRDVGKAPPASAEPALRKSAARVRDAQNGERAAIDELGQNIERASAKPGIPDADTVANRIMERMKNLPCVIP